MNDIIHLTNEGVGAVEIGIDLQSRATSGRRHRITSYKKVFCMQEKELYFLFKQKSVPR